MKIKFLLVLALGVLSFTTNAGILELTGVYQGKNLYVQNPFAGNMKDFCTNDVYVNDMTKPILTGIQSSAYEIDLSFLKLNDPVRIKITHKDDCKPKILNPQVIRPVSAFQFSSFNVDKDIIHWVTKSEKPKGRFFLEQFVNNSWITVKEFHGNGTPVNNYNTIPSHHSGLNKYRIKYLEPDGQVFYSTVVEFSSDLEPIVVYPKRVSDKIYFNPAREADYEVLDAYGNVVRKGKGKEVSMTDLPGSSVYYVNVDNKTVEIFKK